MPELGEFHFLRPGWLLLLPLAAGLFFVVSRRDDPVRAWREVIAPELLRHLVVGEEKRGRFRPVHVLALLLSLAGVAMAGPTWERERPPGDADRTPVVIALDASASMNRDDVPPTRLERAKQKARDFVDERVGARTGLVAYAGSAHVVLPPTEDPEILAHYVSALSTDVMPVAGKDASAALREATRLLKGEGAGGVVLFLTDRMEEADRAAIEEARSGGVDVRVLAIGSERGFSAVDDVVEVEALSVDDGDVRSIALALRDGSAGAVDERLDRWKDEGFYLLYPIVILALFGFRRGFGLRWTSVVALAWLGWASPAHAFSFVDLWLTPDQQGRAAFDRGDYAGASKLFTDPFWRGVACYRDGDFPCAAEAWEAVRGPDAAYDLGNAYAQLGDFESAAAAYERALAARPGWREAEANLAVVRRRLEASPEEDDDLPPPTFDADDVKFDNKENKGTRGEVDLPGLSNEQIGELWLRGLKSDPADFLRLKFSFQAEERTRGAQP